MTAPDLEHRYREATIYAQRAEAEIKRLKQALADQKQATESMAIIAEDALEALEALGRGYQA